jgi:hypothetical protein
MAAEMRVVTYLARGACPSRSHSPGRSWRDAQTFTSAELTKIAFTSAKKSQPLSCRASKQAVCTIPWLEGRCYLMPCGFLRQVKATQALNRIRKAI